MKSNHYLKQSLHKPETEKFPKLFTSQPNKELKITSHHFIHPQGASALGADAGKAAPLAQISQRVAHPDYNMLLGACSIAQLEKRMEKI